MTIDINCDLGEGVGVDAIGHDEAIMPHISSANIACGFHAGDPFIIMKTILAALKHKVAIGAHPGYPDRDGFGRNSMKMSIEELRASIIYQAGAIKSITETLGGKLQHVKLHGALYHDAAVDFEIATAIVLTVKDIDPGLIIFGQPQTALNRAASAHGLAFASEAFADRAYNIDGSLVLRSLAGAVLEDINAIIKQVISMVLLKQVESHSGQMIPIFADTICIHGDHVHALTIAAAIASELGNRKIKVKSLR